MIPQEFPEQNRIYRAPEGVDDSQVQPIPTYAGEVVGGNCDGQMITVVCWKPTYEELQALVEGSGVYLTMFGGLAPHMLTTSFHNATHPG